MAPTDRLPTVQMALGLTLFGALAAHPTAAADPPGSPSLIEGSPAAPAQGELRKQEAPSAPRLEAARREGEVTVDGSLDEEAWQGAPVATGFVQGEPEEGAEPVQPTEVRVLFDGEAIYVGARMHEPSAAAVADQLVRRDEDGQYDYIEVGFDPNLDQQTAYVFRLGASGVERDAFIVEGGGGFGDDGGGGVNWNAVWSSAARIDSAGWTAEMRIPLSEIRFESGSGSQTWGLNFERRRLASNSISYFALISRTESGTVSQYGRLTGLDLAGAGGRFQLEPYAVGQLFRGPEAPGNPLVDGSSFTPRLGADLSYGLGPQFTLDATVNPDFGQVEVDPAVINLTAFETFFPEKRPFFVQDGRIFDFDLSGRRSSLFFSRRIGRSPQGDAPAEAAATDAPQQTTILGASKVTGRTQGGLSMGALAAVTGRETGRAYFAEADSVGEYVAEPLTGYAVGRLQQDFRDGASNVGGILTMLRRDLPENGQLDFLPRTALSGGLDFRHRWGGDRNRRWSLNGFFASTHLSGEPESIVRVQTNPQHYFQRPDAEDLSVDSAATSMTGVNWQLNFSRASAEHWTWSIWLGDITPGFAPNDLGFSTENPRLHGGGRISYRDIEPGPLFRSWNVFAFTFHSFRHTLTDDLLSTDQWSRSYQDGGLFLNGRFEFHNNWRLNLGLNLQPTGQSVSKTRGGPLMTEPTSRSFEVSVSTDPRRALSLEPSVNYGTTSRSAGRSLSLGAELTWRPSPSWQVELEPEFRSEDDGAQYVATTKAVPYEPTYGARYLFGDLERIQLSMQTRLNVVFNPEMSLQLFAQPLLSSGDYTSLKQLARPRSFEFERFEEGAPQLRSGVGGTEVVGCTGGTTCTRDGTRYVDFDGDGNVDYSLPVQDFNIRSLRGNAVLRWEYTPGSELFLVWQHDRRAFGRDGRFDVGRDLDALFGAPAESTFILKASYFLNL